MTIKRYSIILFVFFMVILSSCNTKHEETFSESNLGDDLNDVISEIYEIDNGYYSNNNAIIGKCIVSGKNTYSVDNDVEKTSVVEIIDNEYTVNYSKSIYYPVGDRKLDIYLIGDTNNKVLFDKEGKIAAVLYNFEHIDISENETAENILPLIKPMLEKFENFIDYEFLDISRSFADDAPVFGSYTFLFYNEQNGYITDYCRVVVSCKGFLRGLVFNNLNLEENESDFNVDRDLETKLLTEKMKEIYNTEKNEFVSYSVVSQPRIVRYDGKLYIKNDVGATYKNELGYEVHDWLREFMVPLDQVVTK